MNIAKIILHYAPEGHIEEAERMTRALLAQHPDAIVVDNGSPEEFQGPQVIRSERNLGWTGGLNHAVLRLWHEQPRYEAFWLCNNDISCPAEVFDKLKGDMKRKPRLGIVSAACNSPHDTMSSKHRPNDGGLVYVPFVEFVAPLIRREVFERLNVFDDARFPIGWGVDIEFCWKARRAGFAVALQSDAWFEHYGATTSGKVHGSVEEYQAKGREEQKQLEKLYGSDYMRLFRSMIALNMVVCNEAARLPAMLAATVPHVDEVVIAVQDSQDDTEAIVRARADTAIRTKTVGYCEPDRALVNSYTCSPWRLVLDADERVTPEFVERMREWTCAGPTGYHLARENRIGGVQREGSWAVDRQYRFYRHDNVAFSRELHTAPFPARPRETYHPNLITCIIHSKTLNEQREDDDRYDELYATEYADSPRRAVMEAMRFTEREARN